MTHRLDVALVVVVAAVAAVLGDNIGFWAGRRYGPRVIRAAQRRGGARSRHLLTVGRVYERHGSSVVVAGRFISVVRTYAAFGAGASGMGASRFVALNTLGGITWAAVFGFGSAALGATVGTTITYLLAGVALMAAALFGLVLSRRTGRRREPVATSVSGALRPRHATEAVCGRSS